MKTNYMILLLTLLTSLFMGGCNELRNDKAEKDGVQIFNTNYVPVTYKVNPRPDSLVTFLWPSEEYFERYQQEGLIAYSDYQSFISETSKQVFLNGDAFDEWTLVNLNEGKTIEQDILVIDAKIKPVIAKISSIQAQINKFKKELKVLEKDKKKRKY